MRLNLKKDLALFGDREVILASFTITSSSSFECYAYSNLSLSSLFFFFIPSHLDLTLSKACSLLEAKEDQVNARTAG